MQMWIVCRDDSQLIRGHIITTQHHRPAQQGIRDGIGESAGRLSALLWIGPCQRHRQPAAHPRPVQLRAPISVDNACALAGSGCPATLRQPQSRGQTRVGAVLLLSRVDGLTYDGQWGISGRWRGSPIQQVHVACTIAQAVRRPLARCPRVSPQEITTGFAAKAVWLGLANERASARSFF